MGVSSPSEAASVAPSQQLATLLYALVLSAGLFVAFQAISSLVSFRRNLNAAKASGIPYVCRPIFEYNYFFVVIQPLVSLFINTFPKRWDPDGYLDFYRKDWRVYCKHEKHKKLGDVFWNVSPRFLMLEIADAEVLTEVTTRRADFVKPHWVFENIRLFGPNVLEAERETWRRHRKVIGPRYNEDLHSFVWDHGRSLASQVFRHWKQRDDFANRYQEGKVADEMRGLGELALYIIVGAAFGISIPFPDTSGDYVQKREQLEPAVREAMGFADALHCSISNLITAMIFPKFLLRIGSARWRKLAKSIDHVNSYMGSSLLAEADSIKNERIHQKPESAAIVRQGVVTGLAEALLAEELSFAEAMGNVFLMGLAGSATTADTTHFAIVLLAIHQDVQNWVLEEIDEVSRDVEREGGVWDYKSTFKRLVRLRAVMMETLRLYPVTPVLPKWTADRPQTIRYRGRVVHLPVGSVTVLNFPAVHYNSSYWGEDAAAFRPQRWEGIKVPEGAWAPFSRGARGCMGRRFSESEFASVMSYLLLEHRVELLVGKGETLSHVKERAQKALDRSGTYLTLYVGDDVPLKWEGRSRIE